MYYYFLNDMVDAIEKGFSLIPKSDEKIKVVEELGPLLEKAEHRMLDLTKETRYWEAKYVREKGRNAEALGEFAKAIELEFYKEYEELIPTVMEEKIKSLIKEMAGGTDG